MKLPFVYFSHSRPTQATEFFFRHLVGIQQAPGSVAFKEVHFRPSILLTSAFLGACKDLGSANGTLRRPHGDISAAWACTQGVWVVVVGRGAARP